MNFILNGCVLDRVCTNRIFSFAQLVAATCRYTLEQEWKELPHDKRAWWGLNVACGLVMRRAIDSLHGTACPHDRLSRCSPSPLLCDIK